MVATRPANRRIGQNLYISTFKARYPDVSIVFFDIRPGKTLRLRNLSAAKGGGIRKNLLPVHYFTGMETKGEFEPATFI
jgi:hypothetical protein